MKIIRLALFFSFSFCLLTFGSKPENFNYAFRKISPEGGFTYGSIHSIGEDADGFIWFGTINGLYRLNTLDVKKYVHNPNDSTTIPGNSIRTVFLDSSGTFWIGTTAGVCFYDPSTDRFVRQKFMTSSGETPAERTLDIVEVNNEHIYFLSESMLGRFIKTNKHFEKVDVERKPDETFSCASYAPDGTIWIGGSNGTVWNYRLKDGIVRVFSNFRSETVQKIYADKSGVWIAYAWAGLDFAGHDGKLVKHYGSDPGNPDKINHNRVRDLFKDEEGRIWISTYKGLSLIEKGEVYKLSAQELPGLPYNSIYKIFRDSKNGIWIGTWAGGLAYHSDYDNQFLHFRKDIPENENDYEFVSAFTENSDGTILIGTEFGNLNMLDRRSNKIIQQPLEIEKGYKIENIKSFAFDKKSGDLWIGTFLDGLWIKHKNDPLARAVNIFKNARVSVYSLALSDSGIWIGTYGLGLFHYNSKTAKLQNYQTLQNDPNSLGHNSIRTILLAKDKSIWIGTIAGLNHLDPKNGKIERFNSKPGTSGIRSNVILSLLQDKKENIWIGTQAGGISKYDPKTGLFKTYQTKDGLVGDDIYGIQEDAFGTIWMSTENGISGINPESNTIRNFYRESELQGNQFNPGASFKTRTGEILFGNTKGVTLFTPGQMKSNPFPPKVILTTLAVNNVIVTNHTPDSPLTRTIQYEKELNLSHAQNSLTFTFVANNFLLPNKNQFKYRLVNYDNNWIESGRQNFASYTKIPPGDYVFEVVGSNNDDLWNDSPTRVEIHISPPFWLAWYAYLFYALVLISASFFIRREILQRQHLKKELLLERLTHESDAQLQEMKLRFFTNISHEFRTPLTLIASPISLILEKFRPEPLVREHLLTMQRNANRLLRLINQLIDLRKLELQKMVANLQKTDVVQLCQELISCFEMEAKDKNIHLSYHPESGTAELLLDPEKADKIIFNILSNAMKFTPEKGTIDISVYQTHTSELPADFTEIGQIERGPIICVDVADSGPGIPADEIKLIFERFDQGKNHTASGTGIGLHMAREYMQLHRGTIRVRSALQTGTIFQLCFPLNTETRHTEENILTPAKTIQEVEVHPTEASSEKTKTITVQIIEDNYELRNFLKNLLLPEYKVIASQNGLQGLETALTLLPDLVITDVMMPQMDGFEVCSKLKSNILTSHIPVILLTALNEPEKQIGGFQTGADAYITKPFDERVLLAQVASLINSRTKLREVFSVSDTEWATEMNMLSTDRKLIEKASAIVEQHLNDNMFGVELLAEKLGMSSSSLYRKLKTLTNQSPTGFVRYIRLKKAIKLMDDGNHNVDEVGYFVGFNSHSYFTSSFKKQFGKTPSEYLSGLKLKK